METHDRKRPIEEEGSKPVRLRRIDLWEISSKKKKEITEKINNKIAHLETISADENALMIMKTVHALLMFFCSHLSDYISVMFFHRPNSPEQQLALNVLTGGSGILENLALAEIEKCIPRQEWDAFVKRVKVANEARAYSSNSTRRITIRSGVDGEFQKNCSDEYFIAQSSPMPKTSTLAGAIVAYVDPVKNVCGKVKKQKLEENL